MSRFLVIGAAHIDRRGAIEGAVHWHASNPGRWSRQCGGAGLNAASALARLGHSVTLVSPRGGDEEGALVAGGVASAGIEDRPITFLDRPTPTYSAIVDEAGELVIALAEMALYDVFSPRQLDRRALREAITSADWVLSDANLPAPTLKRLGERCRAAGKPLAAIGISPAKVVRFRDTLPDLSILFLNRREAAALCDETPPEPEGWPQALTARGVRRAVVTAGTGEVVAFDRDAAYGFQPPDVAVPADVTGAGDALAAATLSALAQGLSLMEAVPFGLAAGAHTVASASAAPASLSRDAIAGPAAAVKPPRQIAITSGRATPAQ